MFIKATKAEVMRELDGKGVSFTYAYIGQDESKRESVMQKLIEHCESVGNDVLCCDGTMKKYKNYGLKRVYDNGERSSYLDLSGHGNAVSKYTNKTGRVFYIVDCGFSLCVYTVCVVR